MRISILVCLLLPLFTPNLRAFSSGGHRVIAEIAWRQLNDESKAKYVELLRQHPRLDQDFIEKMPASVRNGSKQLQGHWIFLESAVWPDTTRGMKGKARSKYHRAKWHYVNFPTYLDATDNLAIDLSRVNRSTLVADSFRDDQDFNIIQAIKTNVSGLRDETRDPADRAVNLCWVMHLIGDAHQPIHSTALFTSELFPKGDRGGNLIRIERSSNLHAFWDRLLPNEVTVGGVGSEAQRLIDTVGKSIEIQQLDPAAWLKESVDFAQRNAYSREIRAAIRAAKVNGESEVAVQIPIEYATSAGRLARMRAYSAGWRLATVLGGSTISAEWISGFIRNASQPQDLELLVSDIEKLEEAGPKARQAIPALLDLAFGYMKRAQRTFSFETWSRPDPRLDPVTVAARRAILKIEPLPEHASLVGNFIDMNDAMTMDILRAMGPNAVRAIPFLIVQGGMTLEEVEEFVPVDREVGDLMADWLRHDKDRGLRSQCAEALGDSQFRTKNAVASLISALADDDPYIVNLAIRSLSKHGSHSRKALPELRKVLLHKNKSVRNNAKNAIRFIERESEKKSRWSSTPPIR